MNEIITQTKGYLEKVCAQYPTNRDAIAKLKTKYMKLKINGLDDKEGYKKVHNARMDMKKRRVATGKAFDKFNEEAKIFTTGIRTEKNELIELCEPIETSLHDMEKAIDEEKLRIKNEAKTKERERIQGRIKKLYDAGMVFDGFGYVYQSTFDKGKLEVSGEQITAMTDKEYETLISSLTVLQNADTTRQAGLDKQKKEEEDRIAKVKAEQEAESKRLAAEREKIRKEQEEKESALQAERDKLEADKRVVEKTKQDAIDKKTREAEIEKAKKEAADKAVKEKEVKDKREADKKAEEDRLAKVEAELAEKLKPDNEKLLIFAAGIAAIPIPELIHETSFATLKEAQGHLHRAVQILRQGA